MGFCGFGGVLSALGFGLLAFCRLGVLGDLGFGGWDGFADLGVLCGFGGVGGGRIIGV